MEQCLGENILYREQFGAIPIGRWFGAVGFISPTSSELKTLDMNFAREYLRLTRHEVINAPFEGRETLFELVSRLVSMKIREREYVKKQKLLA